MSIIGLDISTSNIGYTVLDNNGRHKITDHIDLTNLDSLFLKADLFKKFVRLSEFFRDHPTIYVETPLMGFKVKQSMIQTIILLQKFNVLCCYGIYNLLDKEPIMIPEQTARKAVGITIPKGLKRDDKKKMVLAHVRAMNVIPESTWAFKKTGNPKDWCFDRADSFVVAYGAYKLYHEAKNPS
jgi:hypothetical protein